MKRIESQHEADAPEEQNSTSTENSISRRHFISQSGKVIALGFLSSFGLVGGVSANDIETDSLKRVCILCNIWVMCDHCDTQCENANCVTACQLAGGCHVGCELCQINCEKSGGDVVPCITRDINE